MKRSEATNHALCMVDVLEEDGATPDEMGLVATIFHSLVKAYQADELAKDIQGKMKAAVGMKRNEIVGDIQKAIKKIEKLKPKVDASQVPRFRQELT